MKRKLRKSKSCVKCGSNSNNSSHHIIPKVWKVRTGRVTLCKDSCHREIEKLYLTEEARVGKVKFGQRYRLPSIRYAEILTQYLDK